MTTILLLPTPVKSFVRDAARSAGRALQDGAQRITAKTLDTLLGLPEFRATRFELESRGAEDILHLYCEHKHDFALCPCCQKISDSPHANQARGVRDLNRVKWRVFIHFVGRRFRGEDCDRVFTEKVFSMDFRRRQTRRFEQYVSQQCLNSTRKAVALETWLDETTVKGIFKRCAKKAIKAQPQPTVRVLGIDEISLKKRHKQFALVISDLERRCVIAILPGREKERLENWLSDLTEAEQKAIQVVSIDMWKPYRSAVQAK